MPCLSGQLSDEAVEQLSEAGLFSGYLINVWSDTIKGVFDFFSGFRFSTSGYSFLIEGIWESCPLWNHLSWKQHDPRLSTDRIPDSPLHSNCSTETKIMWLCCYFFIPLRHLTRVCLLACSWGWNKWPFSEPRCDDLTLSDREQLVTRHAPGNPSWLDTTLRVPQGLVLGPLLFYLYIGFSWKD